MTRTVEHIVSCHQAARALRVAGKPVWQKRIDIKSILNSDLDNETPDHIVRVSRLIAAKLKAGVPAGCLDFFSPDYESDLGGVVEDLEQCTIAEFEADLKNGDDPCDIFNEWLEVIYDWADHNRVWLG